MLTLIRVKTLPLISILMNQIDSPLDLLAVGNGGGHSGQVSGLPRFCICILYPCGVCIAG